MNLTHYSFQMLFQYILFIKNYGCQLVHISDLVVS